MERYQGPKTANIAIDRAGIKSLFGGLMLEAQGQVLPSSDRFGTPKFKVRYDVAEAKCLMKEVGYSKSNPLRIKAIISPAGSGQM